MIHLKAVTAEKNHSLKGKRAMLDTTLQQRKRRKVCQNAKQLTSSRILHIDVQQDVNDSVNVETSRNGSSLLTGDSWDVNKSTLETITADPTKQRPRCIRKKAIHLPQLKMKKSDVPSGGVGVFAAEDIRQGSWVTEYGGEIIDFEEASERRAQGVDTHIRSMGYRDQCLDSRIRKCWNMNYYVRNHMVGGFLNDAHGTDSKYNCEYVTVECCVGYQHPYHGSPWVSKRVFLRAIRDIPDGAELLVSYGRGYHANHFVCE